MNTGLNIGIGSWIDAQQEASALPAFPPTAIPFALRHLGELSTPEDLVRAAELSLLANRSDQGDTIYSREGIPSYLWERHRRTIGEMITATSVLAPAERDALAQADAVLFKADGFTISDRYALYLETRRSHQDLVAQGAPADEVQAAYEDWVVLGHKSAVEEALAVKVSSSRGTSRLIASSDVTRIEVALESLGGEVPFAPTLFAPISATSTEHWTEAEVDFQALEDTIRPEVSRASWKSFRQNKRGGKVRFRFVVAELFRPWFSTALYMADDWRLAEGDAAIVADGNGREGRLPAYFSRVYLAQVLDVRHDSVRPKPPRPPFRPGTGVIPPPILRPGTMKLDPVTIAHPLLRPTLHGTVRGGARPMPPQRTRGVRLRRATQAKASPGVTAVSTIAPHSVSRFDILPHLTTGTAGRVSKIQKLTAHLATSKLNFTRLQLAAATAPSAPPPDRTTYLVGFGRTNLPVCPNPNPNYQWP